MILLSAAAVGCVPAVKVTVPAVHGRVVDSEHQPVPGAAVHIARLPGEHELAVLTADERGRFARPEDATLFLNFILHVVPIDHVMLRHSLVAHDGGRSSAPVEFEGGQVKLLGLGNSKKVNCGDIVLQER